MNRFFTENGKFFGFRLKDCYEIYRQRDGTKLVELNFDNVEVCLSRMGGIPIIKGLLDRESNKYYPWSMKALAHLSNEHLTIFYEDIVDEFIESGDSYNDVTRNPPTSQIIFGNPMPALFPYMFKSFKDNPPLNVKKDFLIMLNNYTIGPECQNLIHFLAKEDRPE